LLFFLEALSRQQLAFSPRSGLVLFQLASFPARLQKARKPKTGIRSQPHHRFHRIEQPVTFFEVGGIVLKPKRPTLAKTALGWGTLKFRSRPHAALGDRWAAFATAETPVGLKNLKKRHRAEGKTKPLNHREHRGAQRRSAEEKPFQPQIFTDWQI
jgi:hypothetical protein